MTRNQIEYAKLLETNRANVASETETRRHNVVTEQEVNRHNIATEALQKESNLITQAHYERSDAIAARNAITNAYAAETGRMQVGLGYANLSELNRSNIANEAIRTEANRIAGVNAETNQLNASTNSLNALTRREEISKEYDINLGRLEQAAAQLDLDRDRLKLQGIDIGLNFLSNQTRNMTNLFGQMSGVGSKIFGGVG